MGIIFEDGEGSGKLAGVTIDNRIKAESKSNVRGYYVSRDDERAFNAVFEDASAAAGDYVAYLKNTSTTRNLYVDLVRVDAANAVKWKVVSATGAATGGNTVTPVNMNRSSGITASVDARADNVGGFTAGSNLIATIRNAANSSATIPFDDVLVLGQNDAIAIEYDSGTTGDASITIRFYFEDV